MKKTKYYFVLMLSASFGFAQVPQGINYQAVLRDTEGNILPNQYVCVQSTITDTTGSVVYYQETFSTTTNLLGLFTLNIGSGIPVIGTFDTINWSSITPYQQIEIKISCAGSYITMGSSKLLSVPYSLNAATSNDNNWTLISGYNIYNNNLGNVGIGTATPQAKLEVEGTTATTNFRMTNGAGANKILQSDGGGNASWVSPPVHYIGEYYGGGIVFYVDSLGQHGLICATNDQDLNIVAYNGSYPITNARRTGIGAGIYNTQLIIAAQGYGNYAAYICADLNDGGYGDWYLPSRYELNLLYLNKDSVDFFPGNIYWSSTEIGSGAVTQNFVTGIVDTNDKADLLSVRAIRAF